eukprot:3855864-Rhodomonas_salina.1
MDFTVPETAEGFVHFRSQKPALLDASEVNQREPGIGAQYCHYWGHEVVALGRTEQREIKCEKHVGQYKSNFSVPENGLVDLTSPCTRVRQCTVQ